MASVKVIRIPVGYANTFLLVNGKQSVLIDTGIKNQALYILSKMERYGVKASELALIIQTHTHFDHAGNTARLKELTRAKVAVHETEAAYLEEGYTPIPDGTNLYTKFIASLGRKVYPGVAAYEAVKPDILVPDKSDLSEWGIDGYIIHTPGHTEGSLSVVIENRLVVAGDCFFPLYVKSVFPPFCNNIPALMKSWKKIFDLNIDKIYAGHGPLFSRERGMKYYNRRLAGKEAYFSD